VVLTFVLLGDVRLEHFGVKNSLLFNILPNLKSLGTLNSIFKSSSIKSNYALAGLSFRVIDSSEMGH